MFLTQAPQNRDIYYYKLLSGFALSLANNGIDVELGDYSEIEKENFPERHKLVFAINKGRPEDLDPSVRWITWFHDFHWWSEDRECQYHLPTDIVYFIGDPKVFGFQKEKYNHFTGCMFPAISIESPEFGVDLDIQFNQAEFENRYFDYAMIGYLPQHYDSGKETKFKPTATNIISEHPMSSAAAALKLELNAWIEAEKSKGLDRQIKLVRVFHRHPDLLSHLFQIAYDQYESLSGNLDPNQIAKKLRNEIDNYFGSSVVRDRLGDEIFSVEFLSTHLARRTDRLHLASLAATITEKFGIWGNGWQEVKEFAPYVKGPTKTPETIMQNSKTIICNSTHGLGVNERVLQAMMNGCVVLHHRCENDGVPGSLCSEFKDGEHFISFGADDFRESSLKVLEDSASRRKIAVHARKAVVRDHLWNTRTTQLLDDLENVSTSKIAS